jgi:2-polyprenyl-3-methyl-5-hydroxy-6-metoxy-1,4-benzoquinol methylase
MTRRGSLDWLARDPRGRIRRLGLRLTVIPPRTALEKRWLARTSDLAAADMQLLGRVDSRVHPYEDMYGGDGRHYFSVAVSAIRCIDAALAAAGASAPEAILDMPCGFGRVLRSLVARFPDASVTACDIRPSAVRFCAQRFGAEPVISSAAFEDLSFPQPYDLIWCGSLVTHLAAPQTLAVLDLFARSARRGALIVFTTHGEMVARAIKAGTDYMLTPEGVSSLGQSYQRSGYGHANYPWEQHYGISVISPQWIRSNVERGTGLREVYFSERGWDSHQDVFGFVKPSVGGRPGLPRPSGDAVRKRSSF